MGNEAYWDKIDTHEFGLQNFTITGGFSGVACEDSSLCRFSGNTIQAAVAGGVVVRRSRAIFHGDVMQNNSGRGLTIINAGAAALIGVTIQNNAAAGVAALIGSSLIAQSLVSQSDGGFGGIRLSDHSTLRLIDSTLTSNLLVGVWLDSTSEAEFDNFSTFLT
jgi:Right handed beta helix region